jgi:trk system potassium uptake protein TrkH
MRLRVVVHLIGLIVRMFGATFLAPAAVAAFYGEGRDAVCFLAVGVGTAIAGHVMRRAWRRPAEDLKRVEGLATVSGAWLIVSWSAAIPYAVVGMGPIDAVFESMSGLTTTGATVMRDFTLYGRGIFFWRALTHWIGGMGVIALFVAVLPRFAIGGRQLFFAEAPGPTDEKLTPQIRKTAAALWGVYTLLTLMQIVALRATGMPLFDSVCNTFATLAAGGFSPHPLSIAGYHNPAAEWIITIFMFAAGANFALHYRALRGDVTVFGKDEEFRTYLGIVLVASAFLALFLGPQAGGLVERVRLAMFQVVSIITTTGFASTDFELWNPQAKMVLLVMMFIGGCAGSAGGGPKVVRHLLIARYTLLELRRTLHPRGVLPVKLGGRVVPDDVMRGVLVFFLFYLLVFAVCTMIVVGLGADILTGLTATIATLGNIGPGFGPVGPMGHYGDLHPLSKIALTGAMWVGRLEVLAVLALLRPEVWRSTRLSAS